MSHEQLILQMRLDVELLAGFKPGKLIAITDVLKSVIVAEKDENA